MLYNIFSHCQLPKVNRHDNPTAMLPLMRNPRVLISLLTCTIGSYNIGSIEVTLSTFLESISLGVELVAVSFLVMSLSIMLITPVNGYLCEKVVSPWLVSMSGLVFMFVCYLFLGPAPYLPLYSPNIYSVCCSVVAAGVGTSAVLVASFSCAQLAATETGQEAMG